MIGAYPLFHQQSLHRKQNTTSASCTHTCIHISHIHTHKYIYLIYTKMYTYNSSRHPVWFFFGEKFVLERASALLHPV